MILNRMNIVLASMFVVVVMVSAGTRVDFRQPNIEVLPDMKYTPARLAYTQNSVFANGRTLQAPAPGTIARGHSPLHFTASPEDALRAGEELKNPYHDESIDDPTMQDSVRRGGDNYRVFCISCHGATGSGDGPITKRGFPPPPSFATGKSRQMKDGQLFHILTHGQATMPSFAAEIPSQARWDVINYLRSIQPRSPMPAADDSADNGTGEAQANETFSAEGDEAQSLNDTQDKQEQP